MSITIVKELVVIVSTVCVMTLVAAKVVSILDCDCPEPCEVGMERVIVRAR